LAPPLVDMVTVLCQVPTASAVQSVQLAFCMATKLSNMLQLATKMLRHVLNYYYYIHLMAFFPGQTG